MPDSISPAPAPAPTPEQVLSRRLMKFSPSVLDVVCRNLGSELFDLLAADPASLREDYGIRFQHYHERHTGEIVATTATRSLSDKACRCLGGSGAGDFVEVAATFRNEADNPDRAYGRRRALLHLLARKDVLTFPIDTFRKLAKSRELLARFPDYMRVPWHTFSLREPAPFPRAAEPTPNVPAGNG